MDAMVTLFTMADYAALPEGYPAQLVEGQLVREPAPTYGHGRIVSAIHAQLIGWVDPSLVLCAPADVVIDEHNVFQPDLLVLRQRPSDDAQHVGTPLVAMEVLSPATAGRDRTVKKTRLLGIGVVEVWIVDPATQTIEIHTADGVRGYREAEAANSGAIAGFGLIPEQVFLG